MMLVYLVTYTMAMLSPNNSNFMSLGGPRVGTLGYSAIAVSMLTNLLATLLIAYKLWLVNIS